MRLKSRTIETQPQQKWNKIGRLVYQGEGLHQTVGSQWLAMMRGKQAPHPSLDSISSSGKNFVFRNDLIELGP